MNVSAKMVQVCPRLERLCMKLKYILFQTQDDKWHVIFEVKTQQKQRLPIINVTPFKKEFEIEAGDVCFGW